MSENEFLAARFETHRGRLRAVAYRMLGSLSEADDAVQEAWLRLSRAEATEIDNLGGWLTTVVARVCLDALRSRKARPEVPLDLPGPEHAAPGSVSPDAEDEAVLADSVGLALLVVLETLAPAERLAFVLHDLFALPFEDIAPIVGRTPTAARQLASRARRRVQGRPAVDEADLGRQRAVVEAFLSALRSADFDGLLAVLDPDAVVHAETARGQTRVIRGARAWAKGAVAFHRFARFNRAVLINGRVGVVLAPRGRLTRALTLRIESGKILEVEVIADPARLARLEIAVLP